MEICCILTSTAEEEISSFGFSSLLLNESGHVGQNSFSCSARAYWLLTIAGDCRLERSALTMFDRDVPLRRASVFSSLIYCFL
jgi:hypothetical protein